MGSWRIEVAFLAVGLHKHSNHIITVVWKVLRNSVPSLLQYIGYCTSYCGDGLSVGFVLLIINVRFNDYQRPERTSEQTCENDTGSNAAASAWDTVTSTRSTRFDNWQARKDVGKNDRISTGRNSYRRKLVWKLRVGLRVCICDTVSENS